MQRNHRHIGALSALDAATVLDQDVDVRLMLAVKGGDQAAFRELFEKHAAAVIGFTMHFVGSRARAEEITQDVFLQVFRSRQRYEPKARFTTWLYRIAANACVSESRRAERRLRSFSLNQPQRSGDDESPPQVADAEMRTAEDNLLTAEALGRIRAEMAALPPQQRAALWLARVEGMAYDEVAVSLSCSVSAVKSLIHRATVTLRGRLDREGE